MTLNPSRCKPVRSVISIRSVYSYIVTGTTKIPPPLRQNYVQSIWTYSYCGPDYGIIYYSRWVPIYERNILSPSSGYKPLYSLTNSSFMICTKSLRTLYGTFNILPKPDKALGLYGGAAARVSKNFSIIWNQQEIKKKLNP